MSTQTILLILLSGIIALFIALFQYVYKSKKSNVKKILTLLRFVSIFSVLILLINPKFENVSYYEEKPNLVIAIDNSESVAYLKQDSKVKSLYEAFISNTELNNRFNLEAFSFGKEFKSIDSLNFKDRQTNISNVFKNYSELYKETISPLVLITDGNQTLGRSYLYSATKIKQPIYPVILGDTTKYTDLSIKQVNVNRFAYLKNKFPVEIIVNYSGNAEIQSELKITSGTSVIFSKTIYFNASKTSELINTTIVANKVGIRSYKVEITPLESEKNKINNRKNFAVEVIDQKTNIALVSSQLHPDLGTLKKAIETNEQRSVTILKPSNYILNINDYQLVILYQPNNNFREVMASISELKLNTFIITGNTTDWSFLNNNQFLYKQEITNQTENYQPELNINYGTFIVDNITFANYPPLQSEFGVVTFNVPEEIVLYKTINGNSTETSLLSTLEIDGQKHALLSGEGIWRWRAQSFLETESFADFDNFIGKLVQYLSSNKKRKRINVDYKSFYNGNDNIAIGAQFFNKNYEFDANANLEIQLTNKSSKESRTYPLLLKNASYVIDLSGVADGDYNFIIKSKEEPISVSGQFKVLEYNVEQQFLNADVTKLESLATNSNSKSFFIDNTDALIKTLLEDTRFATMQKSKRSTIPLIDWKYLLGLIVLALSLEWFIRKYNGLI